MSSSRSSSRPGTGTAPGPEPVPAPGCVSGASQPAGTPGADAGPARPAPAPAPGPAAPGEQRVGRGTPARTGAAEGLVLPDAADPVFSAIPLHLRQNLVMPAHQLVNPPRGALSEEEPQAAGQRALQAAAPGGG